MATIPTIQLFRNSIIKTGRQAAIDALEAQKASVPDGGLILARYSDDGSENGVKTLLGIVRNSGSANAELTVIDVEGAAENVQSAITSAINNLNKEDTAVYGQYVSSVSEANGIITVTRRPLPSVEKSVMVGEAVTAVTQTNGKIGVEYGSINAAYVSLTDVHGRFESDNVGGALEELHTYVNRTLGSFGAQIGALSTSSTVTLESTEGTEDGVLKVYTIRQGDREVGTINIPKDLVVTSGSVVKGNWNDGVFTENVSGSGTALKLVIANQPNPVYINTLDLVKDHTAGNGIAISNTNEISVVRDSNSEGFLTVSESGVKLSGVQAAINKAAASATTKVEKKSDADKITLESAPAADGSVTYTIGQNDIASAALLGTKEDASTAETAFGRIAKEVADRQAAIAALDLTQVGGNGQVITTISQTAGKVSVTAATLGAENVSASTINSSDATVAVTGDNVKAQIESLAKSIKSASTAAAAAHTKVEAKTDGHVTVSIAKSEDGSHDIVTIAENDIASATDLGTETTNRQNADTALSDRLGDGVTTAEGKTVTAQLQALSGTTSDGSDTISVIGAKKYTDAKVEALGLTQVGGADKVITTISQSNGQVSASAIDLTANNVKATASSSSATAVAVDGATVEAQIASLATSIKSVSTTAAAAHTKVEAKTDGHVIVSVAKSSDGSHDVVTIAENDIASADELAAETTNRQTQDNKIEAAVGLNEEGNHVKTSGHYTSGATTVVGEIEALDTQLKAVSDTLGTGVSTAATVTAQLQALSGSSTSDTSDTISVIGAKKYTDAQIESLDATVKGESYHVDVTVEQSHGKITGVTVTTKEIASGNALLAEMDARQRADTALSNRLGDGVTSSSTATAQFAELSNKLGTGITTAEGKTVTEQLQALSGSSIDGKDVTSVYGAKAYAKDLVDNLNAEVGSTTGTSKTEAIKIVQTKGKIASITLGAFDCGTY